MAQRWSVWQNPAVGGQRDAECHSRRGSVAMSGSAQSFAPSEAPDYERILRVLDDCGRARSLADFREAALDGLARHLGYQHTTFFVGDTPPAVFDDATPVTAGRTHRMV